MALLGRYQNTCRLRSSHAAPAKRRGVHATAVRPKLQQESSSSSAQPHDNGELLSDAPAIVGAVELKSSNGAQAPAGAASTNGHGQAVVSQALPSIQQLGDLSTQQQLQQQQDLGLQLQSEKLQQLSSSNSSEAAPGLVSSKPQSDTGWYYAVGLSAIAALICSVDRAAISVAILPMSDEYGWSDSTKGAINSAFYVGYTITNLVGGYLASSLSAKQVLGWGVLVWSFFTITTPAAAAVSMPLLLANRAVMGAGEGVTFPCVQNIVKGWVPADTRTRALTLIYSGGQLGTIVALITAPLIIKAWGWPAVFVIYGSLGLFWNAAWNKYVADYPPLAAPLSKTLLASSTAALQLPQQQQQQDSSLQQQQQQQGLSLQQPQQSLAQQQPQPSQAAGRLPPLPRVRDLPWKQFFTNRAFLAIVMAHSAFGVGHYVCLSWLPTYYSQEFDVDVQQSALLSVLPWFVTVLVSNSSGWLADWLSNSGTLSMTQTRKLLQVVGSVGPALCLLYLAEAHSDPRELGMGEALALLTATLSIGGFQSAGFASNHQDISSRYAAVLFGITNALSSLMGTCSVYATGLILESTHSWSLVFQLVAGFYLAGAVAFLAWASAEQQFE